MKSIFVFGIAVVFVLIAQQGARAASDGDIGSAVHIVNTVTAALDQTPHALNQGDGVRQNETIAVAAQSIGELRLNDNTKLALGPGSSLKLDTFVYDPEKSTGTIAVDLSKGAFRFITGRAAKSSYTIRSPSAAISVRGTVFDVYVEDDGTMWVLLHEGSVEICNAAKVCKVISNPCGIVRAGPAGELTDPTGWNRVSPVRKVDFATAFPFVENPPQVDGTPRFTRVSVEQGNCVKEGPDGTPPPNGQRQAEATPSPYGKATNTPPSHETVVLPPTGERQQPRQEPPSEPASIATPVVAAPGSHLWNGPYIGINGAQTWQTKDPFLDCADFTPNTRGCSTLASFNIPPDTFSTSGTGTGGGGQVGYNFQTGNLVFGVEADFDWAGISSVARHEQRFVFPCCVIVRGEDVTQDLKWMSTVRGRLGFVTGNALIYATGGLSIGRVDYAFSLNYPDINGDARDSVSKTDVGWTAGGGVELGFGSWSLKTEYLYYDLGSESLNAPFKISGSVEPFSFYPEFESQGHIAHVGINYHLD